VLAHESDLPANSEHKQPDGSDEMTRQRRAMPPFEELRELIGSLPLGQLVQALHVDQTRRWTHGAHVRAEEYLRAFPLLSSDPEIASNLVYNELLLREQLGETPALQEYIDRFPELAADLQHLHECVQFMHFLGFLESRASTDSPDAPGEEKPEAAAPAAANVPPRRLTVRCPHCHRVIELPDDAPGEISCPECGCPLRVKEGKFELLARVGIGSFGVVWKARDTELDRVVALKVWHARLVATRSDEERFYREGRAAAQLRHPGIVAVHEFLELNGLPAIVCDYINGVTLADVLAARRPTPREAARLVAEVADALEYAHEAGLVHRDLKPSNILLDRDRPLPPDAGERAPGAASEGPEPLGRPVIMDFGLALRRDAEETMTLDGDILGTPAYMSPEQAAGRAHQVDGRSDVYSAGVILYELLVGHPPFQGLRDRIFYQVLHDEPLAPRSHDPRVPRDLETICLKAMAREPGQRYARAAELAADLRRFLAGEPIRARPRGRAERFVRWFRRRATVIGLAGALVVLLADAVLGGTYLRHRLAQEVRAREVATVIARIEETETRNVPPLVDRLREYRPWAEPELRRSLHEPGPARRRMHSRLALTLLGADDELDELLEDLLRAPPQELQTLRMALLPHKDRFTERLWGIVRDARAAAPRRLRAASALAVIDPVSPGWSEIGPAVLAALLTEPPPLWDWLEVLQPVRFALLKPLLQLFHAIDDPKGALLAATVLADWAGDRVEILVDLLLDADARQDAVLWPALRGQKEAAVPLLEKAVWAEAPAATEDERAQLSRRQARAAWALVRMGRANIFWPLLENSPGSGGRPFASSRRPRPPESGGESPGSARPTHRDDHRPFGRPLHRAPG
jgi:tRNA A-37 threonylcarbamoyl transferase component Bud32